MGNYISCTLSGTAIRHSKGTKVIFPGGEIRHLDQPTNAAELMLETPNHFLVNSCSLQIGRRFSALSADEDLEMGNVYVMFPMRRVNSVITPADIGRLFVATNSAVRRVSGGKARILPELAGLLQGPPTESPENERGSGVSRLALDEVDNDEVSEFRARLSLCRSRKPLLETITEEPVCSR